MLKTCGSQFFSSFTIAPNVSYLLAVQTLKRKERQQEHEKEHLVRQKIAKQQRLAELRKELGQSMDADEVDMLVWQAGQQLPHKLPQQDDDQTSTASGKPQQFL